MKDDSIINLQNYSILVLLQNMRILLIHPSRFLIPQNYLLSEKYSAILVSKKKKKNIFIQGKDWRKFKIFYFINAQIYRIPDLFPPKLLSQWKISSTMILKKSLTLRNIFAPKIFRLSPLLFFQSLPSIHLPFPSPLLSLSNCSLRIRRKEERKRVARHDIKRLRME